MQLLASSRSYAYSAYTFSCLTKPFFLVYFPPPPRCPPILLVLFLTASLYSSYFLPEQCPASRSGGSTQGRSVVTWVRGWACHAGPCALSPPCCAAAESTEQFPQHCSDQTACLAQAQSSSPCIADRLGMYKLLTCMLVQRLKPVQQSRTICLDLFTTCKGHEDSQVSPVG